MNEDRFSSLDATLSSCRRWVRMWRGRSIGGMGGAGTTATGGNHRRGYLPVRQEMNSSSIKEDNTVIFPSLIIGQSFKIGRLLS